MTGRLNIYTIHSHIVAAYRATSNTQVSSRQLKTFVEYIRLCAPYLINRNYEEYMLLLSMTGVVRTINHIATQTHTVKPIHIRQTSQAKTLCGCVVPDIGDEACLTCGLTIIQHGTAEHNPAGGSKNKDEQRITQMFNYINSVQGHDSELIPETLINKMRRDLRQPKPVLIARWLKRFGHHRYVRDVNHFVYEITGYRPPQLSDCERQRMMALFNLVLMARRELDITHSMAYRYVIFKLTCHVVEAGTRRDEILKAIHLPRSETLYDLDQEWERVCGVVSPLDYEPTQRMTEPQSFNTPTHNEALV